MNKLIFLAVLIGIVFSSCKSDRKVEKDNEALDHVTLRKEYDFLQTRKVIPLKEMAALYGLTFSLNGEYFYSMDSDNQILISFQSISGNTLDLYGHDVEGVYPFMCMQKKSILSMTKEGVFLSLDGESPREYSLDKTLDSRSIGLVSDASNEVRIISLIRKNTNWAIETHLVSGKHTNSPKNSTLLNDLDCIKMESVNVENVFAVRHPVTKEVYIIFSRENVIVRFSPDLVYEECYSNCNISGDIKGASITNTGDFCVLVNNSRGASILVF